MYLAQENLHIQKLKNLLNSNIFLLLLILFTLIKTIYNLTNINSFYNLNDNEITGIVTSINKEEDKSKIVINAKENILVYYDNIDINIGDKIKVMGKLELLSNNTIPNLFNYKKYMLSKNIHYKMIASKISIINKNNTNAIENNACCCNPLEYAISLATAVVRNLTL